MYKFYLAGVEIRRTFKPKKAIVGALTALDIKISDFEAKLEDRKYRRSNNAMIEVSEIFGALKILYQASILTPKEYRLLVRKVNEVGEEIDSRGDFEFITLKEENRVG